MAISMPPDLNIGILRLSKREMLSLWGKDVSRCLKTGEADRIVNVIAGAK
jgi:hypothetical protein